ncbi:MAG: hypothetical protein EOP45_00805 [Sphingobacteriaceae bacterium]|nr:MAG: hypothetical protein EOP45_00805 [Sphingobacteriaceae bacterium]
MKNLLLILAIAFTSFTVPKKTALTEHSKIVGIWKVTSPDEKLEGLDFYPNGLVCIRTHLHTQNASFKVEDEKTGLTTELTGKLFSYPYFSFTAKIDGVKQMDLAISYQGITKVIRMVKVKDVQSGFLLVK